jgi:hypothetical protein
MTAIGKFGTADLSGMRFGRLVAHSICGMKNRLVAWLCECDCGMYAIVQGARLIQGRQWSCEQYGCDKLQNDSRNKCVAPFAYLYRDEDGNWVPTRKSKQRIPSEGEFGAVPKLVLANRRRKIEELREGQEVYIANNIVGSKGTKYTLLRIEERHVSVRTRRGAIRWFPKYMIRLGYGGIEDANAK